MSIPRHDAAVKTIADALIAEEVVKRHGVIGWKRPGRGRVVEVRSTNGMSPGPRVVAFTQDSGGTIRRNPAEGALARRVLATLCRRASQVARGLRTPAVAGDPWDVAPGSWCWDKGVLYGP